MFKDIRWSLEYKNRIIKTDDKGRRTKNRDTPTTESQSETHVIFSGNNTSAFDT
ncbi:MAG: hypothetical protein J5965_12845 [Aeriscardovia sp.]|nr:hypothetical protein [Aeriscardovia sp.]